MWRNGSALDVSNPNFHTYLTSLTNKPNSTIQGVIKRLSVRVRPRSIFFFFFSFSCSCTKPPLPFCYFLLGTNGNRGCGAGLLVLLYTTLGYPPYGRGRCISRSNRYTGIGILTGRWVDKRALLFLPPNQYNPQTPNVKIPDQSSGSYGMVSRQVSDT